MADHSNLRVDQDRLRVLENKVDWPDASAQPYFPTSRQTLRAYLHPSRSFVTVDRNLDPFSVFSRAVIILSVLSCSILQA
jgi:hypothetical protein